MSMKYNVPIVVVAYNRPQSLTRLLKSLQNAVYQLPVKLIISIDKSDVPEVAKIAENFQWKYGDKEVINHVDNLGLRNHILTCGDLTKLYDGIILLEDDLFVSPWFYSYTLSAIDHFNKDKRIGGISLYAHSYNETAQKPFIPLTDNSDVFFMQLPSSWGQCWTRDQWQGFIGWYEKNGTSEIQEVSNIPMNVASWPKTSWKKYFIWYLIEAQKYFVYPRISLSTNCGDAGTHFHKKLYFQQVPILTENREFRFVKLDDSKAVYDANCEILPEKLNALVPFLKKYSYTVDLYGCKTDSQIRTKYILTTRKCSRHVLAYSREIKPHEANIICGIEGEEIFLAPSKSYIKSKHQAVLSEQELGYFFNVREYQVPKIKTVFEQKDHSAKELVSMLFKKIWGRIHSVIKGR